MSDITKEVKYAILEDHVNNEMLQMMTNYNGFNDEVLDYIAEEYGIDFGEYAESYM